MKRGLIRTGPDMPPLPEQRAGIAHYHPDAMLFEIEEGVDSLKVISTLLASFRPGDILVVHDVNVFFGSTGEVAKTVRNLLEVGVEIRLTGEGWKDLPVTGDEPLLAILGMLADREQNIQARGLPYGRSRPGGSRKRALSTFQLAYARKLHDEGVSLRHIGLIFQASPADIWAAIGSHKPRGDALPFSPPPVDIDED